MKIKFTSVEPWYSANPSSQFWCYYDMVSRLYFCFARYEGREYEAASATNFNQAWERLYGKIEVPTLDNFIEYQAEDLKRTSEYTVNI